MYDFHELWEHLLELEVPTLTLNEWAGDDEGMDSASRKNKFKEEVEKHFIKTRSIALQYLQDGINLQCKLHRHG
jgi:hypothetical protein